MRFFSACVSPADCTRQSVNIRDVGWCCLTRSRGADVPLCAQRGASVARAEAGGSTLRVRPPCLVVWFGPRGEGIFPVTGGWRLRPRSSVPSQPRTWECFCFFCRFNPIPRLHNVAVALAYKCGPCEVHV